MINDKTSVNRDLTTRVGVTSEPVGCEKQREDYGRFVKYMNEKARLIGMTASHFNDAAGMNNISTARDLLKLAVYVRKYPVLEYIWSQNTYSSQVMGPNARTRESISKSLHPDLDNYYRVLGKKGGTLQNTQKNLFVYNLISVLEIPDTSDRLIIVVMYAHGDNTTPDNRFHATKQIADIAIKKYKGESISDSSVCCENAIAAIITKGEKSYDAARILYEKNADMPGRPMSVSKILTAMCVLDCVSDLNKSITYHEYDTNIGGFYVNDYFVGDEVCYEDALYVLMLESSNVTAETLGRSVGKILNEANNTVKETNK